ncbi:hypothetical protein DMUE_0950 [Dictyocoela muelleri]|nr:hypothetical protein DMUE_0950 [Dictyocoela muelleri]
MVNRTRRDRNLTISKDYDISAELLVTNKDAKFLLLDSGINEENRIVVFTTIDNIRHYAFSKLIICDGTFKAAPSTFTQLYTIQCRVNDSNLPLIYCFMKNKDEVSYDKLFRWLVDITNNYEISNKSVVLDFKTASYNSIKRCLTNVSLYGCAFPLGQIVWRQMQQRKISLQYKNNIITKMYVKMIMSLAFVTKSSVVEYSLDLEDYFKSNESREALIVFNWFKSEYYNHDKNNISIKFLHVYDRLSNGIPRTTKSIEGYHRHLNTLITHKQSSFYLILKELKSEQTLTEIKLLQSLNKDRNNVKESMVSVIELFYKISPIEYVRRISLVYNWNITFKISFVLFLYI